MASYCRLYVETEPAHGLLVSLAIVQECLQSLLTCLPNRVTPNSSLSDTGLPTGVRVGGMRKVLNAVTVKLRMLTSSQTALTGVVSQAAAYCLSLQPPLYIINSPGQVFRRHV